MAAASPERKSWFSRTGRPQFAGLTSAEEIASRQLEADALFDRAARRSSLAGVTLRVAVADMREVLVGLPEDLFGASGRVGLWDLMTKNDRLRGLGLWLLVVTFVGVAVL